MTAVDSMILFTTALSVRLYWQDIDQTIRYYSPLSLKTARASAVGRSIASSELSKILNCFYASSTPKKTDTIALFLEAPGGVHLHVYEDGTAYMNKKLGYFDIVQYNRIRTAFSAKSRRVFPEFKLISFDAPLNFSITQSGRKLLPQKRIGKDRNLFLLPCLDFVIELEGKQVETVSMKKFVNLKGEVARSLIERHGAKNIRFFRN